VLIKRQAFCFLVAGSLFEISIVWSKMCHMTPPLCR
jgi:hypothetical protein